MTPICANRTDAESRTKRPDPRSATDGSPEGGVGGWLAQRVEAVGALAEHGLAVRRDEGPPQAADGRFVRIAADVEPVEVDGDVGHPEVARHRGEAVGAG